MKITTRVLLSFLAVSILPVALVGYLGLQVVQRNSALALDESTAAMKALGEAAIHQQGIDVARQVEIYLLANPQATMQDLQASTEFQTITIQQVGKTGYTCLYEADSGITRIHPNPALVDRAMSILAADLPSFWAVFQSSLDGQESAGYYDWRDPDGSIRQKYMAMVPVGRPLGGITLMIAATTYIDEFYSPIEATRAKMAGLTGQMKRRLALALVLVGLLALALALQLARGLSRPLQRLIAAAEDLERGVYRPEILAGPGEGITRRDDLGRLAVVFDRMARQVVAREDQLRDQVRVLTIQIDESRRAHQVAEITETEYFRALCERARELRQQRPRQ